MDNNQQTITFLQQAIEEFIPQNHEEKGFLDEIKNSLLEGLIVSKNKIILV